MPAPLHRQELRVVAVGPQASCNTWWCTGAWLGGGLIGVEGAHQVCHISDQHVLVWPKILRLIITFPFDTQFLLTLVRACVAETFDLIACGAILCGLSRGDGIWRFYQRLLWNPGLDSWDKISKFHHNRDVLADNSTTSLVCILPHFFLASPSAVIGHRTVAQLRVSMAWWLGCVHDHRCWPWWPRTACGDAKKNAAICTPDS